MLRSLPLALAVGTASVWLTSHARAPAVRAYQPSRHEPGRWGDLGARAFGHGPHTVLLLHGMGATGDYWSRDYDLLAPDHRVVVPDLLGFGRSLDESRLQFTLDDHLEALETCIGEAAPSTERLTVVAHSMGSAAALAFAARHAPIVQRVLCAGAPVYATPKAAESAVAGGGPMARLFLLDTGWAKRACALSCRHRDLAGALAAMAEPSLPIAITRRAALHTWPAYRDSLDQFVLTNDWLPAMSELAGHGVRIDLVWGTNDPIGDPDHVRDLLVGCPTASRQEVIGAGHHLPITHAGRIVSLIAP